MTSHDKFEEMAYVYSIGALDGEDLALFENHLDSGCDICSKILKDNREIISVIPYSADPESPPSHLEKKLMNAVSQKEYSLKNDYRPSIWQRINPVWYGLITAFASVLLIITVSSIFRLKQAIEDKNTQISVLRNNLETKNIELENLRSDIQRSRLELASLKGTFGKYSEVTSYLQDTEVVIINLVSLLPELKAVGRILWQTKDNNLVFISSNLPETPPGKIYQMWLIADGTPKSVGIFNVGGNSENIVDLGKISDVENVETFAVTLEPAGGVPSPTGEMYLAGDV